MSIIEAQNIFRLGLLFLVAFFVFMSIYYKIKVWQLSKESKQLDKNHKLAMKNYEKLLKKYEHFIK